MRHTPKKTWPVSDQAKPSWKTPAVRDIRISTEELHAIRTAEDPAQAFSDIIRSGPRR